MGAMLRVRLQCVKLAPIGRSYKHGNIWTRFLSKAWKSRH